MFIPLEADKEGNLETLITRAIIKSAWGVFNASVIVNQLEFSPLEKEKVFCLLASEYYRALKSGVIGNENFREYGELHFEETAREVVSRRFSAHQILKELKFINEGALDADNNKRRLILRLANHHPQKTIDTLKDFKSLLEQFWNSEEGTEEERGLFDLIRQNIDFWGVNLSLEELQSLNDFYAEKKRFGALVQDLKIDRQHDETLWFLQIAGAEKEDLNLFARVVYALEPFYRGRARKYENSSHAKESDAGFNHLLRCVDIDMGVLVESDRRQIVLMFEPAPLIGEENRSRFVLEQALTTLLHDALEDANPSTSYKKRPIKGLKGEAMSTEFLELLLVSCGVETSLVKRLVQRSQLLDKKSPYVPANEQEKPATYLAYLQRIFNSQDHFAMRSKVADFFQNSQTDLAQSPEKWKPELIAKCKAWQQIFQTQPGLLDFLAQTVSPVVVLRWQQFATQTQVTDVLNSPEPNWLAQFQREVNSQQEVTSNILREDRRIAA